MISNMKHKLAALFFVSASALSINCALAGDHNAVPSENHHMVLTYHQIDAELLEKRQALVEHHPRTLTLRDGETVRFSSNMMSFDDSDDSLNLFTVVKEACLMEYAHSLKGVSPHDAFYLRNLIGDTIGLTAPGTVQLDMHAASCHPAIRSLTAQQALDGFYAYFTVDNFISMMGYDAIKILKKFKFIETI